MSSPDAAPFLAENLGQLTHPELGVLTLVNATAFAGQHEEQQAQARQVAKVMAEGVVHTLEAGGYQVVKAEEVAKPPMLGSHPLIKVQCSKCGQPILQLTPNSEGVVSVAASTVTGLEHRCPL